MLHARSQFSLIAAGQFIFAIGGEAENMVLDAVERYDTNKNQWKKVQSMFTPRAAAAAALYNDQLYVIGGHIDPNANETASVERFDIKTGRWTAVERINMARDHLLATVSQDNLIVAGGYDSTGKAAKVVEKYDMEKNIWIRLPALSVPNGGGTMFVAT